MDRETKIEKITDDFFGLHRDLYPQKDNIMKACEAIIETYKSDGTVSACGNGGSAADTQHIVGELAKGFIRTRPLKGELKENLESLGDDGKMLAQKLQTPLRAISFSAHTSLNSAFANDVGPDMVYAQNAIAYTEKGDCLIGISTSGNARNVYLAMIAAKAKGATTIALTGNDGGKLKEVSDIVIIAPSNDTYRIQEYHLIIYHFICAFVEMYFFEQ